MRIGYNVLLKEYLGGDEENVTGFKEAGDALADFVTRGERYSWNEVFLRPIGFLYRHYLELECKFWIKELANGCDEQGHPLEPLWEVLRPLIEPFCRGPEDQRALNDVEEVILTFAKYDPKSQDFRYTRYRDGQPTLRHLPAEIDANEIKRRIGKVSSFFDGLGGVVSQ